MAANTIIPAHIRGNEHDAIADLRREIKWNLDRKVRARNGRIERLYSYASLASVAIFYAGFCAVIFLIAAQ